MEMLKPSETVTLRVQHRPDDFSLLKDSPGDGFYIRYGERSPHTHSHTHTHTCARNSSSNARLLSAP